MIRTNHVQPPTPHLHLMADYGAAGVWDHAGTPLDPGKLPLSPNCAHAWHDGAPGSRDHSRPRSTSTPSPPRAARSRVR